MIELKTSILFINFFSCLDFLIEFKSGQTICKTKIQFILLVALMIVYFFL